jgi:tetratricopeptide (TPR) repeat protein
VAAILLGDVFFPEGCQALDVGWDRGADVLHLLTPDSVQLWVSLRRPAPAVAGWDVVAVACQLAFAGARWRASYQDLLDSGWQHDAKQDLGATALRLGDLAKAAASLDGLPAPQARANHGFALLGLGQVAAALTDFDAALAELPTNDEACFGCALVLEALGRRTDAAAAFKELLARSPEHISARVAREHLRRLGE